MLGPRGTNCFYDFEGETNAIFEASAVLVGALIGERGEEFVHEIAMSGVDLDEVKARGQGAVGGGYEVRDDLVHAGAVECCWERVSFVEANGGWSYGVPSAFRGGHGAEWIPGEGHAGFAAGVG
jgi:hypothetical protein